jgi:hypothetical protein
LSRNTYSNRIYYKDGPSSTGTKANLKKLESANSDGNKHLGSESTGIIGKKVSLYEHTSYCQNKNIPTRKVEVLTGGLREKNDLVAAKKKTGVLPGKISIA